VQRKPDGDTARKKKEKKQLECEECGEPTIRRTRCKNCKKLVCTFCYNHSFHTVNGW
jgi:formylmethanofuran dehydrogenase subunit E